MTTTEYLKGWILFYIDQEGNIESALEALVGHSLFNNKEQFVERVNKYIETFRINIQNGVEKNMNVDEIISKYFKNLPKFFNQSLSSFIKKELKSMQNV